MKIIETLRQASLNRTALTGFASLLVLFVLACLCLSRWHVDNYYDQPIVGKPIELVAKYASHYKRLIAMQSELEKLADDFEITQTEATITLKNYSEVLQEVRIAKDAAGASSEEEFPRAFEAACIAQAHCNEVHRKVEELQAVASAKYTRLFEASRQYEALRLETKRAKDDKDAVACGGTRRFVVLDVSKVIQLDRRYVDSVRVFANGDEKLLVCLSNYDSAFERMNKILIRSARQKTVHDAGVEELNRSKRAYDEVSEKAISGASAQSATRMRAAYQRWQQAMQSDKLNSAVDLELSAEYRAASMAYENALHEVILAAD